MVEDVTHVTTVLHRAQSLAAPRTQWVTTIMMDQVYRTRLTNT
jgi:hypothetical protein